MARANKFRVDKRSDLGTDAAGVTTRQRAARIRGDLAIDDAAVAAMGGPVPRGVEVGFEKGSAGLREEDWDALVGIMGTDQKEGGCGDGHVEGRAGNKSNGKENVKVKIGEKVEGFKGEDERPFPLMSLPPEIRLEIYRACLTRPFKIALSRRKTRDEEDMEEACDEEESAGSASNVGSGGAGPSTVTRPTTNTRLRARRTLRVNASRFNVPGFHRPQTCPSLHSASSSTASTTSSTAAPHAHSANYPHKIREYHPQDADPLINNLLRVSKTVYKEARDVLYSENIFTLNLSTAVPTLSALHQRSRRHIKWVELTMNSYADILERFSEVVRLSLRYCSGLRKFVIFAPFTLPGPDGLANSSSTIVYVNGFDILRWLPQQCEVVMLENESDEIRAVIAKHSILAKTQDKLSYARRQLLSNEAERSHYA